METTSLWLGRGAAHVDLRKRFAGYPHFTAALDEYVGMKIPKTVPVWYREPAELKAAMNTRPSEKRGETRRHVREIAHRIVMHDDVPPVLLYQGKIHDGRHRALAAWWLGLSRIPVVDITPYWQDTKAKRRPVPSRAHGTTTLAFAPEVFVEEDVVCADPDFVRSIERAGSKVTLVPSPPSSRRPRR